MKYSEHKKQIIALGKNPSLLTFIAWVLMYKTKEALAVLSLLLTAWIATLIIDPRAAASIRHFFMRYFSG